MHTTKTALAPAPVFTLAQIADAIRPEADAIARRVRSGSHWRHVVDDLVAPGAPLAGARWADVAHEVLAAYVRHYAGKL